jgi:hypothetical protein
MIFKTNGLFSRENIGSEVKLFSKIKINTLKVNMMKY